MDPNKDYYFTLGLELSCTPKQIRSAFRRAAKSSHPDAGGTDEAFREVNEAHEILSDSVKRSEYDLLRSNPKNSFRIPEPPRPSGTRPSRDGFGEDLEVTVVVEVTPQQAWSNEGVAVRFRRRGTCSRCNWTGFDPDSPTETCEMCDGHSADEWGDPCRYCDRGTIHTGICLECQGQKVLEKDVEFELSNVGFIRDGGASRYRPGAGHQSRYFRDRAGGLTLLVRVHADPRYRSEGEDLVRTVDLHFQDAIDGVSLPIDHLDGKIHPVVFLPRTKDGDRVVLRGMGFLKEEGLRGDLVVEANVVVDYSRV